MRIKEEEAFDFTGTFLCRLVSFPQIVASNMRLYQQKIQIVKKAKKFKKLPNKLEGR
jgi:hypothetical protein